MTQIDRLTQAIHSKKAILYMIAQARLGNPIYTVAYKDPTKWEPKEIKVRAELEVLQAEREELYKNPAIPKRKKGRPFTKNNTNLSFDSYGNGWTQKEIDKRRSEAYREKYKDNPNPACEGSGIVRAECTAHIIPQARCKQLRKTELIWDLDNMFPATFEANRAIENPKGQEWKALKNKDKCLAFIKLHDPELYMKFITNQP